MVSSSEQTENGSLEHHRDEKNFKSAFADESDIAETLALSSRSTSLTDNPYFSRDLDYTTAEESAVIRILDTRLFPWILLTTFVLNMDRTNISNAISDNLPADLGFNINVVNTATAIYSVLFSIFTLTGAVIAKYTGPARCKSMVQSV